MAATPKKKHTKARRGKRRLHQGLELPNLIPCPKCSKPKLSHTVCSACGAYGSSQIKP